MQMAQAFGENVDGTVSQSQRQLFYESTLFRWQTESARRAKPERAPGEALIKVLLAGICGTDREILKGYSGFHGIPGHEFVGRVVECDDPQWIGQRVVGEINLACGHCTWCAKGLGRHCPTRTVLGIVNRPGVFAEYVTLPVGNLPQGSRRNFRSGGDLYRARGGGV